MTPLGDGHGPDAPKHPTQRFLTSPEGSARVVALSTAHAKALDELTDPVERVHAALLIGQKVAEVLMKAGLQSAVPFPLGVITGGNSLSVILTGIEDALRSGEHA